VVNPYGSGDASRRILDIVRRAGRAGRVKPFVDSEWNDRSHDGGDDGSPGAANGGSDGGSNGNERTEVTP
jgi:UDP-N-acetylglucosamine 2-epimerase (non-hydrolysing)